MSRFRLSFLALIVSAFASMNSPALADEPLGIEATYYFGESKMMTADGKLIRTSLTLAKRVANRTAKRIEEHVMSINEKDSKAFVVIMEVNGNKMIVSEKSNAFSGEGELFGDAWKWKEWKTVSKMAGGIGTTTSEDTVTEKGLVAKKSFANADGKVVMKIEELLTPISPKTYEILYARLSATEKK